MSEEPGLELATAVSRKVFHKAPALTTTPCDAQKMQFVC